MSFKSSKYILVTFDNMFLPQIVEHVILSVAVSKLYCQGIPNGHSWFYRLYSGILLRVL